MNEVRPPTDRILHYSRPEPVIDYIVIMAQSGTLSGMVNRSMDSGWQPYGSPQFIYRGVKLGVWAYQAMVKYGETK